MVNLMKWKRSSFIVLICLVFSTLNVFAHDSRYLNPSYRIWTDTVNVNRTGNEFSLTSDTSAPNQSTSIVDYKTQSFSSYEGMVIGIETDGPVNFTLLFKSNNEYRYQEDEKLLLIDDGSKMIKKLVQNFETYTIDQAFSGRLYLPFNQLKENLKNLEFWSIIFVQNANESLNIKINSIQLVNGIDNEWYDSKLNKDVISESEIQIPVQGESLINLPIVDSGYFIIEDEVPGVRIENNKLIIDKSVDGEIPLLFVDEFGYKSEYPIKTYQSWILNETANGINIAFPDTTTNLNNLFKQWFDVRYTPYIQITIGVVFGLFLLFYRLKRNKRKVNKNVI